MKGILLVCLICLSGCATYCDLPASARCEVENLIERTSNDALDNSGFPVLVDVGPVCPDNLVCPSTLPGGGEAGDWTILTTTPHDPDTP